MEFDKEKVGDVFVIRIKEKKLTSHEAPEMKTTLLELIMGEGEKFLLNMKNVEQMDSTGLGAFLFGIRQADRYEKDMRFCEIQPKVQFLIRIAHLDDVIKSYETEKDGLQDFREESTD